MLRYIDLSRQDQRAAKRLAKHLLYRTPAAHEPPTSPRGALNSVFMKPENLVGVLVYGDGKGNWWGDVALKAGTKCVQMGTPAETPKQSYEDAMDDVKRMIASIKAKRIDPLVQWFCDQGFDPERTVILRVRHSRFGCRWLARNDDQIAAGARSFAACPERASADEHTKIEQARQILLETAPRFAANPVFLRPNPDSTEVSDTDFETLCSATAFLLQHGIVNVDQGEVGTSMRSANVGQAQIFH